MINLARFALRLLIVSVLFIVLSIAYLVWKYDFFGPGSFTQGTGRIGTLDPSYEFCDDVVEVQGHAIGYASEFGSRDLKVFLVRFETPNPALNRVAHFAADNFETGAFPDLPNRNFFNVDVSEQKFYDHVNASPDLKASCVADLKQGNGSLSQLYAALK